MMPWIRTVAPDDAEGRLKEAYAWQSERLGHPTEFTQLGSLDAEVVHARLWLYKATEQVPSRLTERQRELIGYLTSILNGTPHCAAISRARLKAAGDDELVAVLDRRDFDALDPADAALAAYVEKLTLAPGLVAESDIDALRSAGFDDLDILDANNRIAHLNYTNRIANGLGLRSVPDEGDRSVRRVPA